MVVYRNPEIRKIHRRSTASGGGRQGLASASVVALLLAGAMLVPGCLVTTGVIAVISIIRSDGGETATVKVEATPREVYAAMLRVVAADPDIILEDKDDEQMTVSVSRGKETASGSVQLLETGHTELTVKGKSPEGREESTDLARRAATRVCDELGVSYELVEN